MSAAGSVPVVSLPPQSCLNNLNVLLSGGGGAGGGGCCCCCCWLQMRDPHEKENCSRLTLIILNVLRGGEHTVVLPSFDIFFFFSQDHASRSGCQSKMHTRAAAAHGFE